MKGCRNAALSTAAILIGGLTLSGCLAIEGLSVSIEQKCPDSNGQGQPLVMEIVYRDGIRLAICRVVPSGTVAIPIDAPVAENLAAPLAAPELVVIE